MVPARRPAGTPRTTARPRRCWTRCWWPAGAVGELVDPDADPGLALRADPQRVPPRRRPPVRGRPAAGDEAAELAGRHGLAPSRSPRSSAGRSGRRPSRARRSRSLRRPGGCAAELVAALGVEAAGRRAELARRAHPYDPEGFPVPVGPPPAQRPRARLVRGGRVLVALACWSRCRPAAAPTGALPGPALAAAVPAAAAVASTPAPLPTLRAGPVRRAAGDHGRGPAAAGPGPGGADRRPAAATAGGRSRCRAAGDRRRDRRRGLAAHRPAGRGAAGPGLRRHLGRRPAGPGDGQERRAVARVTAGAGRRGTVALAAGDGTWAGELAGLPTGRGST